MPAPESPAIALKRTHFGAAARVAVEPRSHCICGFQRDHGSLALMLFTEGVGGQAGWWCRPVTTMGIGPWVSSHCQPAANDVNTMSTSA